MKKTILISALAVAATLTAGAKTADELRIYINPGHGSWTPNDRPNPIVGHGKYDRYNTDTTNFFESNTNLRKGFGVLERLIDYGLKFDRTLNQEGDRWQIGAARDMSQNIVMSHVKCGPFNADNGTETQFKEEGKEVPANLYYYNRNLSEICAEVNANNFDMFISIHSNAATEGTTTNYPLYLYRGYDTPQEEAGVTLAHQNTSIEMAKKSWGYAIGNPHAVWTSYNNGTTNIRGDINFYKSSSTNAAGYKGYLGALKHGTPGFLVEGYFHTYQPARHRAMNWDVCRVEGIAYARGIADYFGLQKENFGTIYGIVRDLHEKFHHDYYSPNPKSKDLYLPLNGVKVLLQKDGQTVAEYTTDENYNGAFVFDRVEPGTYTLVFEHPSYKAIDPVEVVVKAATDSYPTVDLENVDWVPPTKTYETYPDPAAKIQGLKPADDYAFTPIYTDEPIADLEGKIVRRAIVNEGKMYVLAIDKLPTYAQVVPEEEKPVPTIVVYDLTAKKVLANVSTEGAYGSIQNIADIQVTSDGVLLGICQTKTQYDDSYIEKLPDGTKEPRGVINVYRWANDEAGLPTGDPEVWFNHTGTGRWFRAYGGSTFAYQGTSSEGLFVIAQPTITGPVYKLRATAGMIVEGEVAAKSDYTTPNTLGEADFGEGYRAVTSPLNLDNFYYAGSQLQNEYTYKMADAGVATSTGNDVLASAPATSGIFKYAGASYMVVPTLDCGQSTGLKLVNISDNLAGARVVGTTNTTLEELATTSVAAAGEVEATYDEVNEVYTSAWINLYVLRDGKISKVTTKGVKQPIVAPAMAYGLTATKDDNGDFVINYSLSEDAVSAEVVLTPNDAAAEGDEENASLTYAAENTKGDHTLTITASDLDETKNYSWVVNVHNKANVNAGEIFADNSGLDARRGGVVPITDPTKPSFGYTVVCHGMAAGIDIYNPAGEKVGERLWKNHKMFGGSNTNQSNPFRGVEREGMAVLPTWGDGAYGIVVVDPLAQEEPKTMFAGTKQGAGHFLLDGTNLGGGTAGICFVGTGENTKLYSFSEDHQGQNGSGSTENSIVRYNIGTSWIIDQAPEVVGFKSLLANTNVDMIGYGDGFFVSQVRGAGNNAAGTPCFAYIDSEYEEVTFNSADLKNINDGTAGIAISTDGKTFAHASAADIQIYSVEWDGTTPKMTLEYTIPTSKSLGWTHLRFDAAGKLHAYERENNGYHVYALQSEGSTVTTPAGELLTKQDGVNNIVVTDEAVDAATPVYYNINGVQVPADNLTPGVYVKVAGGKATKVIVK